MIYDSYMSCIYLAYISYIAMTGSAKIDHVAIGTKTDIHFIAQDYSYTQGLSIHDVSIGQCEEVYFSGGHFVDPVKSRM